MPLNWHPADKSRGLIPLNIQGAEMRAALMSIEKSYVTYSEGMTYAAQAAHRAIPEVPERH
jgi:hypothetical protein